MAIKMRLYNPEWKSAAITDAEVEKIDVHGRKRPTFEIMGRETSAVLAELGTAASAVLNGITTPVSLYITSSQANDDNDLAAADAKKIRIIGITVSSVGAYNLGELPLYTLEEINLNGVANVRSIRYYLRVIHAYCSDWGTTGSDAVGNITVESPENTTLITIAAGANESNACVIYGISGRKGRWTLLDLGLNDATVTDITEGAILQGIVYGENNTVNIDDEFGTMSWQVNNYTTHIRVEPEMFPRYMSSVFNFTFKNLIGEAALDFQAYILYEIS